MKKETVSNCHGAKIHASYADGVIAGSCSKCYNYVSRINPSTGVEEWLDGNSPWTKTKLRAITSSPEKVTKDFNQYATDSAERVIAHALYKKSRGKKPSMTFKGVRNPKIALIYAKYEVENPMQ